MPGIFTHLFESSRVARAVAAHAGLQGLLDSVGIILQTPCKLSFFHSSEVFVYLPIAM